MRAKVFLALVLVALLLILVSTVSASTIDRTYTEIGGVVICNNVSVTRPDREVRAGKPIIVVYKGEKIRFRNSTGSNVTEIRINGPYTSTGSLKANFKTYFISNEWDTEGKYEGYYRFSDDANGNGSYFENLIDYQGWLRLDTHTFRLELYPTDKTYADGSLNLRIKSNNKEAGFMKFSIESGGYSIRDIYGNDIHEVLVGYIEECKFNRTKTEEAKGYNITAIYGVNITEDGKLMLDMSKLDVEKGRYTIILEDSATGVKKKINFDIKPKEIEIKVDDKIVKGDIAKIIIKSAFPYKRARLLIDGIQEGKDITLAEDGEKLFRWDTTDVSLGRHEIRIQVDVDGDGGFRGLEDEEASRYIGVVEGNVSIALSKDTIMIGDPLKITGKSNYGRYAVFVIDDKFVAKTKITKGKFEYEYRTAGEFEGAKKIEVFIDAPVEFGIGTEVSAEWKMRNGVDADAAFTLIESKVLTLDLPHVIAKGDDVVIKGTASGTGTVYLLVLNGRGEVIFPYEGVAVATEVRDTTYEGKLIKPDVGVYTVIVLHKGRDGVTDAIQDGKWVIGEGSKTLDLRVAIVEDAIKRAGSDDIFVKKVFKVINPEVKLELEDATFGENLTIVARTNVKEGAMAWISVGKEGSKDKEIKTVKVDNGTIMVEFDTNKLSVGRWKVSVNIPGRCSDEGIISIKAKASTSTSTATPIATGTPSLTATPSAISAPEENTREAQIPGFELVNALAVLFAVAYLIRKKGGGIEIIKVRNEHE